MSIVVLCASLRTVGVYAQEVRWQVLSVDEMFSLADQHSKSLRPAVTGVQEAREAVRVARNAKLPEINASLTLSYLGDAYITDRNFSDGTNAPMPHFGNNFALEVSQVLYSGGAVSGTIALAGLQEENAQLALDAGRNQLRFSLMGYYLDLFKQRNMLRVYEKNIELTQQVLQDIRVRSNQGIVLKNDITRYELQLSNLQLARTRIRNSLSILNEHLITTLGMSQGVRIEPDTTLLAVALPIEAGAYWQSSATEHSPSLKQRSLAREMNKQQERLIRSEQLPSVALIAGDHLDGPITIEVPPINKNLNYWYVGVGVKYSLSSLYKTDKQLTRHRLTTRRVQEEYDAAKEQTELAAHSGFINYMEAYEQLATQRKSVELSRQNYAVVSNRYTNDMALITDMLDASNSLLEAEVQLTNAQINVLFNYYKLLYISGTL